MNRKYAIFATLVLTILGGSLFFIWQTKQKTESRKSLSSYPSVIITPDSETGDQIGATKKVSEETLNSTSGQVAVDTTVQPKMEATFRTTDCRGTDGIVSWGVWQQLDGSEVSTRRMVTAHTK